MAAVVQERERRKRTYLLQLAQCLRTDAALLEVGLRCCYDLLNDLEVDVALFLRLAVLRCCQNLASAAFHHSPPACWSCWRSACGSGQGDRGINGGRISSSSTAGYIVAGQFAGATKAWRYRLEMRRSEERERFVCGAKVVAVGNMWSIIQCYRPMPPSSASEVSSPACSLFRPAQHVGVFGCVATARFK